MKQLKVKLNCTKSHIHKDTQVTKSKQTVQIPTHQSLTENSVYQAGLYVYNNQEKQTLFTVIY